MRQLLGLIGRRRLSMPLMRRALGATRATSSTKITGPMLGESSPKGKIQRPSAKLRVHGSCYCTTSTALEPIERQYSAAGIVVEPEMAVCARPCVPRSEAITTVTHRRKERASDESPGYDGDLADA